MGGTKNGVRKALQTRAQISERNHQHHVVRWRELEAKTEVEGLGLFADSVHDHAANADGVSCCDNPLGCIANERAAYALALIVAGDGEACERDDRNWIRHVPAHLASCIVRGDRTGCERVIADDAIIIAQDEGSAGAAQLIETRAATQPIVKRCIARIEVGKIVGVVERFGCLQRHGIVPPVTSIPKAQASASTCGAYRSIQADGRGSQGNDHSYRDLS